MSDDTQLPDGVDESERGAWEAWLANGAPEDADLFRDTYYGEYGKVSDFVEEQVTETQDIPGFLEWYIDWELMARDWEINGDIWTERTTNGYHIFRAW